jgi:hypothetical protein
MIAATCVQADKIEFTRRVAKIVDSILATRDGVFKGQRDTVQSAIGDAHTPDEVLNVVDVLLVGLGGEDNKGAPGPITFPYPTVGEEYFLLFEYDGRFMGSVAWLFATDWLGAAGIDTKFEPEDGLANARFVEHIPIFLHQKLDFATRDKVNSGSEAKALFEFGGVTRSIAQVDISSAGFEKKRVAPNCLAVLGEYQQFIVDIVAIVKGDVTSCRFRSPYFQRNIDDTR